MLGIKIKTQYGQNLCLICLKQRLGAFGFSSLQYFCRRCRADLMVRHNTCWLFFFFIKKPNETSPFSLPLYHSLVTIAAYQYSNILALWGTRSADSVYWLCTNNSQLVKIAFIFRVCVCVYSLHICRVDSDDMSITSFSLVILPPYSSPLEAYEIFVSYGFSLLSGLYSTLCFEEFDVLSLSLSLWLCCLDTISCTLKSQGSTFLHWNCISFSPYETQPLLTWPWRDSRLTGAVKVFRPLVHAVRLQYCESRLSHTGAHQLFSFAAFTVPNLNIVLTPFLQIWHSCFRTRPMHHLKMNNPHYPERSVHWWLCAGRDCLNCPKAPGLHCELVLTLIHITLQTILFFISLLLF